MSESGKNSADHVIRRQMEIFATVVGAHVAKGQPYALLDYPNHANIGDSAIYSGELAFLDHHVGRRPACVCTIESTVEWLDEVLPDGPILLHGGGNFGDLWMPHQNFRHAVLARYRDRKVVQLAQSIHYRDPALRDETARLIAAHKDFTLLVRDRPSYDFATKHFDCVVQMCPDAAMMMWRIDLPEPPQMDLLAMLRDDHEAVHDEARSWLMASYPFEDWQAPNPWTLPIRILWKLMRSLPDGAPAMRLRERVYRRNAMIRVMAGAHQLGKGRRIVTDRLHVHLISSLIRRPHVVLDNSYGKISRYIDAWGQDDMTVRATSLGELQAALV